MQFSHTTLSLSKSAKYVSAMVFAYLVAGGGNLYANELNKTPTNTSNDT